MPPASLPEKVCGSFPATACTLSPCAFPIDVVYLDSDKIVVHLEENLKPWRVAPVRCSALRCSSCRDSTLTSTQTAIGDEIEIAVGGGGPGVNDAPNFLVEWPSRWDEFLTAIRSRHGKVSQTAGRRSPVPDCFPSGAFWSPGRLNCSF